LRFQKTTIPLAWLEYSSLCTLFGIVRCILKQQYTPTSHAFFNP
jgi:hypothetical protein